MNRRTKSVRLFEVLVLAAALGGCGGEVQGGDSGSSGGAPSTSDGGTAESDGTSSRTPLPQCEPGFEPNSEPNRACDWLAKGLCYETKLKACACVCPRDKVSTCSSGFPSPESRTPVFCF